MVIFHDIGVKTEVKDPERLTSYNRNTTSTRPDVCEAYVKYEGKDAPNSNGERTMTHPKDGFLKGETTKRYGDCDSQYGDNRSWRFKIHRGNKNQNDEEGKKT